MVHFTGHWIWGQLYKLEKFLSSIAVKKKIQASR
jgi:hypothetical protein